MSFRQFLSESPAKAIIISEQATKKYQAPDETWNFQDRKGKKLLYEIFRREGFIFRAILFRSNLAVHRGFKLVTRSEKSKAVLKEFFKILHPSDPITALKLKLRNLEIDAEWSGNAYLHKIWNGKAQMYSDLKQLHPIAMDFKRDNENKILVDKETQLPVFYKWKPKEFSTEEETEDIPVEDVAHLRHTTIGDELLGISLIEPMYKTVNRLKETYKAIAHGIFKHASPLHDVIVGDEVHPPTKEMIDKTADEVAGLSYKTEYVHPPWIRVAQLEAFSLGRVSKYTEVFLNAIQSVTGVPKAYLLGVGEGTNKATIQAQNRMLRQLAQPIQDRLSLYWEKEIFGPLMERRGMEGSEIPQIEWNDVLPEEESSAANRIKILSNLYPEGRPLLTWAEARELAGLPSKEPGVFEMSGKKPGIYLVKPHGLLIYEGDKKAIVKEKKFPGMIRKPLILVSEDLAYGIIELTSVEEIDKSDFKKLRSLHRVSEKEAQAWWPEAKKLYYYPIKVHDMFKRPVKVKVPKGTQTFIKDVEFLEDAYRKPYGR